MPRGVTAWTQRSYTKSWVDALQDAIERLPWAPWLTYLAAFLLLAGLETGLKWSTGTYPVGTFHPWHVVGAGTGVYAFALVHYLDLVSGRALDTFRGVMRATDAEAEAVRRRLTTMPAWPAALASIGGIGLGVIQRVLVSSHNLPGIGYATSGPVYVFEYGLMVSVFLGIGILFYHSIRQLGLIDYLYRECALVRLFDPAPLYAFSRVTARTALGTVFAAYAWLVTYPRSTAGESTSVFAVVLIGLALLAMTTFALPLWGAHQRLEAEKLRRKAQAHQHVDEVLARQRAHFADDDHTGLQGGAHAMASLTAEIGLLEKASTWPWETGAFRGFLTAIMLPLLVWLAEQLIGRWLLVP